jgi:nucleoid-associated protein YgaU
MTTLATTRMIVPLAALAVGCGLALVLAIQHLRREPPVEVKVASAVPAVSTPASAKPGPEPLQSAQAQANALIAGLAGSPALPKSDDAGEPTFDVARIEPTGEAVIAGRSRPGATVELLRNGELHDRTVADQSGQFVMVPSSRLPSGTYDLTLRSREPNGKQSTSRQSVAVAIEPRSTDRPVVALVTPDKPTVVLSQPESPKPTPGTVVAEAVEIESGGKFHASGRARPGGTVRLYLNEAFIASATAAADGRFAFTINEGIAPGNYRVRLDEVDSKSGAVHARAEVPFNVTANDITGSSVTARAAAARPPGIAAVQQPQLAAAGATVLSDEGPPTAVVVPKILTTKVSRGDSLWRISQLSYGLGTRYATIYKANREQIRNPNLIYPGQVFVIPNRDAHQ